MTQNSRIEMEIKKIIWNIESKLVEFQKHSVDFENRENAEILSTFIFHHSHCELCTRHPEEDRPSSGGDQAKYAGRFDNQRRDMLENQFR